MRRHVKFENALTDVIHALQVANFLVVVRENNKHIFEGLAKLRSTVH